MDGYRTVRVEAQDEFTEKRSRFIGMVKPVATEEEAVAFINRVRTEHWNASHHVYAYSLRGGQLSRYSDDAEPQGTAGMPTLEALTRSGVTDTVLVTVRYFGGILLGTGGLARAYSHAAALALAAGGVVRMVCCKQAVLLCEYHQYDAVARLLSACGASIDETVYGQDVELHFHVTPDAQETLWRKLADATSGAVEPEITGEAYFPLPDELQN